MERGGPLQFVLCFDQAKKYAVISSSSCVAELCLAVGLRKLRNPLGFGDPTCSQ